MLTLKIRNVNSQKHVTHNGISKHVLYWKNVRTNVSSVSSKYITAKVCNESQHCPICGLYYAGKFTGTIDIALAVCLIKTFCLIEAVNGRLLGTE